MIKLYLLLTLASGHQIMWSSGLFTTAEVCEAKASVFVDRKMATGLYDRVEAQCAPAGGSEI